MSDDTFSAMQRSIIDRAPETAFTLAQQALSAGTPPLDAINHGFVPGMPVRNTNRRCSDWLRGKAKGPEWRGCRRFCILITRAR